MCVGVGHNRKVKEIYFSLKLIIISFQDKHLERDRVSGGGQKRTHSLSHTALNVLPIHFRWVGGGGGE